MFQSGFHATSTDNRDVFEFLTEDLHIFREYLTWQPNTQTHRHA